MVRFDRRTWGSGLDDFVGVCGVGLLLGKVDCLFEEGDEFLFPLSPSSACGGRVCDDDDVHCLWLVLPALGLDLRVGWEVGECPFFGELGDAHFGHTRFKKFLILYFGGHVVVSKGL